MNTQRLDEQMGGGMDEHRRDWMNRCEEGWINTQRLDEQM